MNHTCASCWLEQVVNVMQFLQEIHLLCKNLTLTSPVYLVTALTRTGCLPMTKTRSAKGLEVNSTQWSQVYPRREGGRVVSIW